MAESLDDFGKYGVRELFMLRCVCVFYFLFLRGPDVLLANVIDAVRVAGVVTRCCACSPLARR